MAGKTWCTTSSQYGRGGKVDWLAHSNILRALLTAKGWSMTGLFESMKVVVGDLIRIWSELFRWTTENFQTFVGWLWFGMYQSPRYTRSRSSNEGKGVLEKSSGYKGAVTLLLGSDLGIANEDISCIPCRKNVKWNWFDQTVPSIHKMISPRPTQPLWMTQDLLRVMVRPSLEVLVRRAIDMTVYLSSSFSKTYMSYRVLLATLPVSHEKTGLFYRQRQAKWGLFRASPGQIRSIFGPCQK